MRFGLYLYFRPSLGGGERYLLTAAEALRELGDVDFLTRAPVDLAPFADAFGLDLSGVRNVAHPFRSFHGVRDWLSPRRYDFFLALDNHLAPMQLCLGRRGALHLQTPPYERETHKPLRSLLKLRTYDEIVCNSEFTMRWAKRHGTGGLPVRVIHPPVETALYGPGRKTRSILSVGRFFTGRHEKRHDVLIDAFRELVASGLEGWELRLAGSIRSYRAKDVAHLESLRERARGLPVSFHVDASLEELQRLYGEASLYWHAAGYGVDENTHPERTEHFGMSAVEAMSAGAVPLVVPAGGIPEIVTDGETGFFWRDPADLVVLTRRLVGGTCLEDMRTRVVQAASRFSRERFVASIRGFVREHVGR